MLVTMMTCPKCQSEMRTYERNGINVDQCSTCRGIFLDRGELEHLIDAEGSFYTAGQPTAPVAQPQQQPQSRPQQQYNSHDSHHNRDQYQQPGGYYKKKKSFLGDLLDF